MPYFLLAGIHENQYLKIVLNVKSDSNPLIIKLY